MPIDKLSGTLLVPTRDQSRDRWLKDAKFYVPDADTGPQSQYYVDGTMVSNVLAPFYANALKLGDATSWRTARGDLLSKHAEEMGRPRRSDIGASGYVIVEASSGGGTILAGAILKYVAKDLQFEVLVGGPYANGDLCPIRGISTGSSTNLDPDTELKWESPPPGIFGTCKVFENADGSGLSGGAPEESDDQLIAALLELQANPPSSGNEAAVIFELQRMPGIALEKAFVYPCVEGPGEYAVAFTMRPDKVGASRLPNGAHIAQVDAYLQAIFPGDDGIIVSSLAHENVVPCVSVRWSEALDGFVDSTPWPPYQTPNKVIVDSAVAATVSTARLKYCVTPPSVGKNIALYDSATQTFKVKRILTVVGILGPDNRYDVTFDMTGGASDPAFIPSGGAVVSPYAVNMSALVEPILSYGDQQGPGEFFSFFADPGKRQRRVPTPKPDVWPHTITNALLDDLFAIVEDAALLEPTTPKVVGIGTVPLLLNMHKFTDIAIFAK